MFENALAIHEEEAPNRWENVAALIPGKDVAAVKRHYEILREDIGSIDAGIIPIPSYCTLSSSSPSVSDDLGTKLGHSAGFHEGPPHSMQASPGMLGSPSGVRGVTTSKSADQERRKGIPWTEEEHRLVPRFSPCLSHAISHESFVRPDSWWVYYTADYIDSWCTKP